MTSIDRMSVERLAEYISPDVRRVMLAQADRIEELEAKAVEALMLADGELDPDSTVKEYLTVQTEGPRQVNLHPCLERQVKLVVKAGCLWAVCCLQEAKRSCVCLSKQRKHHTKRFCPSCCVVRGAGNDFAAQVAMVCDYAEERGDWLLEQHRDREATT